MPVSHIQAREITERLSRGHSVEELAERLAPHVTDARRLPPRVPAPREWSTEAHHERVAFLAERGTRIRHLAGLAPAPDPATLRGSIENFIGMTQIPTGLIGPLRINGLHAHGDFYVPLATSEGALVASYDRGANLITAAGGVACLTTTEQVQRAPAFVFGTIAEAAHFAAWAVGEFQQFQAAAAGQTRHGRLLDMMTHIEANHVYLIFAFHTADAAGQNMVTFCTAAICEEILARTPVQPRYWFLESNMSGDKKATALSFLQTRGRNVTAEVTLPRTLVEKRLHTTPERMSDYWRISFVGGVQSGSIGVNGHIANGIAALFLACGQDVACVSEATVGVTRMEVTEEGDLYCGISLPSLIVGSVGGGTRLPTARECLGILQCEGEGGGARLAEICAALALAGELSIVGALCSGDFARAHGELGR
ncbi:MAG TPA: hydroxymethylglutaryl-CoA reductase, partial [Longimicrobiaceae bacterium]|nr:hydroxymethylglutaryl-CoA reductase [Longimicrobiaceae bacterium]